MNAPEAMVFKPLELERRVLRCVLAESARVADVPLIRGLAPSSLALLCKLCAPDLMPENAGGEPDMLDEFDDLFDLLRDFAEPQDQISIWLAAAIATAAQRNNHLWQDMGLPSRRELSAIMALRFPRLAEANVGDMKWKKFFYRQLCQRAELPICKSPSCGVCVDHAECFGPEC